MRLILLFAFTVAAWAELPRFREVLVTQELKMGYQLVAVDLNRDGRQDLIVVDERSTELVWFENPGWQRHVLAADLPRVINLDCLDLDSDGVPEIVMAHHFESSPERSRGTMLLLKSGPDPRAPWTKTEFDQLPTAHRVRWAKTAQGPLLVMAPLVGLKAKPPEYDDAVPIYAYKPGEWKRATLNNELRGVLHSIAPVDWDGNGRDHILTASFDGLRRLEPRRDGGWTTRTIHIGDPRACPLCGSSEVKVGRLGRRRFIGAIEPWHGNQVVVYTQEGSSWKRTVIEDSMVNGHALAVGDLDGDGRDEIVAGFRGKGHQLWVFQAEDERGARWRKHVLDDGGIAAADCKIEDFDGDGRPDIACSGASTGNVKLYLNQGR